MLCKWCGAKLPDFATKCKRCGKDIPAISDCGGFYDLVPDAKKLAAKREPLQDAPKLEFPAPAAGGARPGERKSGNKRSSILPIIAIALCVVLIAVLLLDVKVRLEEGSGGRDRDDEDIGSIIDLGEDPGSTDPSSTDPGSTDSGEEDPDQGSSEEEDPVEGGSEEEKPTEDGSEEEQHSDAESDKDEPDEKKLPLEEQELEIQVGVELKDEKIEVSAEVNAGDISDEVFGDVDREDDPSDFTVEIGLGEYEDVIDIEIENLVRKDAESKEGLSLKFKADDVIFGKEDDEAEFILEFRSGSFDEWKTLDEDMFQITRGGAVVIQAEALRELLGDEGSIELKVTYRRASKKGGTLTVIVSGLEVDAAAYTEKK